MVADEIGEVEWQMWVDRLSREGLSRSRISTFVAVASAIYALRPDRRSHGSAGDVSDFRIPSKA